MKALRALLAKARANQSGLTLVEVLVAVMVFAIIFTGVAYTIVAVLNVTKESSAREEATNLAAQDIDLDRSISNLFALLSDSYTKVVNGTTYTITRSVEWVTDGSVTAKCGTGGGNLQYKRVNVAVDWTGEMATSPVRADTLINPAARINDGSHGTILVSVNNAAGSGTSGVVVSATPSATPNGATTLTTTPAATDGEGCTYILSVSPGNYDVKISRSGYLDVNQNSTATTTVSVGAASAASVSFQFDQAGTFNVTYPSATSIPTNLDTSYISTYGTYSTQAPVSSQALYPFPSGYQVISGAYADPALPGGGCASPDPGAWPAGTALNGKAVSAGVRPSGVGAAPGGTAAVSVGMGTFTITGITNGLYVTAVQIVQSGTGDPGCANANLSTYRYAKGSSLPSLTGFALPWGTWKIYTGSSAGAQTTQVAISRLAVVGNNGGTSSSNGGTITLDPRLVAP
jgi:prepilin-type N-terminal cleavage/methylation domain-containing protein